MSSMYLQPNAKKAALDSFHSANSSAVTPQQRAVILRTLSIGQLRVLSTAEELSRQQRENVKKILNDQLLRSRDILEGGSGF